MRGTKIALAALLVAATFGVVPTANAQTVQFLGAGSSALFQILGVAAYNDLCYPVGGTAHCHHYTIKGTTSTGNNFAQIVDSRASGQIPPEGGNLEIIWNDNPLTIWGYLAVDTIVGNRAFFAVPRTTLQVDSSTQTTAGKNLTGSNLFVDGSSDAAALPANVWSAVQTAFTAAGSDIRPEDAKLGTNRALANWDPLKLAGLGYGQATANCTPNAAYPTLIGCAILSSIPGGATAHPVQYNISGYDPFNTTLKVPAYSVIPIGGEAEYLAYNGSDPTGLGAVDGSGDPLFKNINRYTLANLFNGSIGRAEDLDLGLAGNTTPVTVWLREPLSGTMNTFEFNVTRTVSIQASSSHPALASQEAGVNMANPNTNPLALPGPGGSVRRRGIGNGEVTNGVSGVGGVLNTTDSVAYGFFSYGNVAKFTPASNVRYVTVDGVDPINRSYGPYTFQGVTYTAGQFPICSAPCGDTAGGPAVGTSLPNVRNGSYKIWNILRIVSDATSTTNYKNAATLVAAIQNDVDHVVPDFVPYVCTDTTGKCTGEPGLQVFRSHYKVAGLPGNPSNGNLGEPKENGGDLGGGVFPKQADVDFFNDSGKTTQLVGWRD